MTMTLSVHYRKILFIAFARCQWYQSFSHSESQIQLTMTRTQNETQESVGQPDEAIKKCLPVEGLGCSSDSSCKMTNWPKPFLRRNLSYIQNLATPIEESNPKGEILYHFHQTIPNPKAVDGVSVKTLFRKNLKCPLCTFKADDVQGLWMHLTTTNFNFEFSALKDTDGMIHIAANSFGMSSSFKKRLDATSKLQAIYSHETEIIFCRSTNEFCRYFPYKSEPVRPYEPDPFLEDILLETNELQAPSRDFHHPVSGNKITIGEWMLLKRIVTPSDTTWKKRIMYAVCCQVKFWRVFFVHHSDALLSTAYASFLFTSLHFR